MMSAGWAGGPDAFGVNRSGWSARCMSMRKTSAAPVVHTTAMYRSGDDADPEMQLKKRAAREHAEIMKLSRHLLAIHG